MNASELAAKAATVAASSSKADKTPSTPPHLIKFVQASLNVNEGIEQAVRNSIQQMNTANPAKQTNLGIVCNLALAAFCVANGTISQDDVNKIDFYARKAGFGGKTKEQLLAEVEVRISEFMAKSGQTREQVLTLMRDLGVQHVPTT